MHNSFLIKGTKQFLKLFQANATTVALKNLIKAKLLQLCCGITKFIFRKFSSKKWAGR